MEKDAKLLLDKYRKGICTPEESAVVERWYMQLSDDATLNEDRIDQIGHEIWQTLPIAEQPKRRSIWPRIAAAAALFIVLGAGFYIYNKNSSYDLSAGKNIQPGKNTATLTLASGQKIRLSDAVDGEVAKEAGITITKTKDGQLVYAIGNESSTAGNTDKINTLTTAAGETYQVRLPDGSNVWLNAASSLKYPVNFAAAKERRVELTGEAYFEVAKVNSNAKRTSEEKKLPFIVVSNRQQVKVLGTHFNISSYSDDDDTKTTLLEGSVYVFGEGESALLVPNQQAVLTSQQVTATNTLVKAGLKVTDVNAGKAIAWKNGKFEFVSEDIESILKKIARWYNVEIVYQDELVNKRFSGSFSRFDNVAEVLQTIQLTNTVHFKIEGRRILVMK
jgi:transmembrane sensor